VEGAVGTGVVALTPNGRPRDGLVVLDAKLVQAQVGLGLLMLPLFAAVDHRLGTSHEALVPQGTSPITKGVEIRQAHQLPEDHVSGRGLATHRSEFPLRKFVKLLHHS